jgi:NADPH-dependent 2,4-dienoyl-CoA reductase/sulfur reductase-like enzyme
MADASDDSSQLDDASSSQENEEKEKEEKDLKSAALEWAKKEEMSKPIKSKKRFAVVGGGWGGWGAAKALCEAQEDVEVILLDALPDPTGATPFLSKTGKPGTWES